MSDEVRPALDVDVVDVLLASAVAQRVLKAMTPPAAPSVAVTPAAVAHFEADYGADWPEIVGGIVTACLEQGKLRVSQLGGSSLDVDEAGGLHLYAGQDTDPIVSLPASKLQALLAAVSEALSNRSYQIHEE